MGIAAYNRTSRRIRDSIQSPPKCAALMAVLYTRPQRRLLRRPSQSLTPDLGVIK